MGLKDVNSIAMESVKFIALKPFWVRIFAEQLSCRLAVSVYMLKYLILLRYFVRK